MVAISQSGETANTPAVLSVARERNLPTLRIVNVVSSIIARKIDVGFYNYVGSEIGAVSTKMFTSQLSTLTILVLFLSREI